MVPRPRLRRQQTVKTVAKESKARQQLFGFPLLPPQPFAGFASSPFIKQAPSRSPSFPLKVLPPRAPSHAPGLSQKEAAGSGAEAAGAELG